MQGHPSFDASQREGADLLAHGDAAVQQGHLQGRAHLLALLLGALVERGDEAERDGERARLRHDGGGHADEGKGAAAPHDEGGQYAGDHADVDAGNVHQAWPKRRLQEDGDDHQGGDELQHGLELAPEAEGGDALAVGDLLDRAVLCMLIAAEHGVGKPLPPVDVPGRVPNPHQALHHRQVVEEAWAALHCLDDVQDRGTGGLLLHVVAAHQRRLPGHQELDADTHRVEQADANHQLKHVLNGHAVDLHDGEADKVADSHHEDENHLHGQLLLLRRQVGHERSVRGLQDVDRHVHDPVHGSGEKERRVPGQEVLARREEHPRQPSGDQPRKDDRPPAAEARGAAVGRGADDGPREEAGDGPGHVVEGGQGRAHAQVQHVGGAVGPDEAPEHLHAQLRQGHEDELPEWDEVCARPLDASADGHVASRHGGWLEAHLPSRKLE
mmetsp:Transcript_1646/g.4997  ORF Transcript_1646/g.4997 Transcript_1646/m.4997 type:complete len:441 (+) Transcript_1646:432-1754(+)